MGGTGQIFPDESHMCWPGCPQGHKNQVCFWPWWPNKCQLRRKSIIIPRGPSHFRSWILSGTGSWKTQRELYNCVTSCACIMSPRHMLWISMLGCFRDAITCFRHSAVKTLAGTDWPLLPGGQEAGVTRNNPGVGPGWFTPYFSRITLSPPGWGLIPGDYDLFSFARVSSSCAITWFTVNNTSL